jgi:L-lysine 6-transaminase
MLDAASVHDTLRRHQMVDGFRFVFDLDGSHGIWLRDARNGDEYLDTFTCFASWPVGYNHPALHDPVFEQELLRATRTNPANSDLYTREMAAFVEAFSTKATPAGFPHHFWISGGALAVENALKTAFDWKARKLGRTSMTDDVNDLVILHFKQAFHGRSGYTMSLTNTLPDKIGLFPKFDWPRVHNPALVFDLEGGIQNDVEAEERRACAEIDAAFARHGKRVAAILIEPMQGEGGDNHFRTQFLRRLRRYADEEEALLIFDEVQTGFFGSGKPWLWQHHGIAPDLVVFGKKTQVCGFYASARVDEVEDNVFHRPSRINSTWGGNLGDMVRSRRLLEIILAEDLAGRVAESGAHFTSGLRALARERACFDNVRGIGSLLAFTLETTEERDRTLAALYERKVLALKSGTRSIRFRLPLVITTAEVDELLRRVAAAC